MFYWLSAVLENWSILGTSASLPTVNLSMQQEHASPQLANFSGKSRLFFSCPVRTHGSVYWMAGEYLVCVGSGKGKDERSNSNRKPLLLKAFSSPVEHPSIVAHLSFPSWKEGNSPRSVVGLYPLPFCKWKSLENSHLEASVDGSTRRNCASGPSHVDITAGYKRSWRRSCSFGAAWRGVSVTCSPRLPSTAKLLSSTLQTNNIYSSTTHSVCY